MKRKAWYCVLLAGGAVAGLASPAIVLAQEQRSFVLDEVVVTARRREERLQDVPVSITVLSQEQMHNANISSAGDIASYTPSLQVNTRFGPDATNFAIRGFSQELRSTASVGVYFAEVVAPRGANTTQTGDGAGPGDFFDLESVQVLKGPQGTLFGRNTTGGAVVVTPKKPTDEFEGYIEGSLGNYDMRRIQGVVNIPIADSLRARFGVDQQERDGYLRNISGIGPDRFADMDYLSLRGSLVWDITDRIENYTIVKYSDSDNDAPPFSLVDCDPTVLPYGPLCQADLNRRVANGQFDEYDVYNFVPNPKNDTEQWQIINTTTFEISDNLTVKNILSYAEFESRQVFGIYGTDWRIADLLPPGMPVGNQHLLYQMVGSNSQIATTDQKTWVEEFQLQGTAFEDRLTWQAGLYWEKSKPNGTYGSANPSLLACDQSTLASPDINDWRCNNMLGALFLLGSAEVPPELAGGMIPAMPIAGAGSALHAPGGVTYENRAVYFQGTWSFNDQWSVTGGLRYTHDKTKGHTEESVYYFPGSIYGGYFEPGFAVTEVRNPSTSSEEPTWTLGVEYKPTADLMLYGKYSRGYRQGSVNLASIGELDGRRWDVHDPEKVDTYEIGAKSTFHGRFPGSLNVALFYNDFQDQQIQFGYLRDTGVATTSIINAGASTIWGVEIDGNILLTDNLSINASYAYLDTEVDKLTLPEVPAGMIGAGITTAEGEPLSYAPKNQLVVSANQRLPLDESIGDVVATLTYIYSDEMQGVSKASSPYAVVPSYELVNASINWNNVMGGPVDVSLFATNLLDEKYRTYIVGQYTSTGIELDRVGVPRMYGARLRYNF